MLVLVALLAIASVARAQGDSVLYGMSPDLQLETINTTTAQPIFVWPQLAYEAQGQGLSSIDSKNGIFYIIGTNLSTDTIALVGQSTINGSVIVEIVLPFLLEAFIGVGQYVDVDETTGDVYVTGRDPQSLSHVVYRVNPFTKELHFVTRVGDGKDPIEVLGGVSVLDPVNRVLWVQLARNNSGEILLRFYGYDPDTGFLLNILTDQFGMMSFDFYPQTGLIYGIGAKAQGQGYVYTLVSLNSATTQFKQIKVLPGFSDMLAAVTAIDVQNGILWTYLTAKKEDDDIILSNRHVGPALWINRHVDAPLPSMNLVGVSIATATVIHSVLACEEFPDCPWNIQSLS